MNPFAGPGVDGYAFPNRFGPTCAAFCHTMTYSVDGSVETCANATTLYGQSGCFCRDMSFASAPTLPPTPAPALPPSSPPTQSPQLFPTVAPTDEASLQALVDGAAWAGQGTEGLFNAIDHLGLLPGGAKTDMVKLSHTRTICFCVLKLTPQYSNQRSSQLLGFIRRCLLLLLPPLPPLPPPLSQVVTIEDSIFANGDVFVYGGADQSTLRVAVASSSGGDDDASSLYTIMLLDVDFLNPGAANGGGSSSGWGSYVHGLWANR
jgi:hypothetical protein